MKVSTSVRKLDIGRRLTDRGARVRAHDPVALERAPREYGHLPFCFTDSPDVLATEADALVLVTGWPQYRSIDWNRLAASMRTPILLDGRNYLKRDRLEAAGFRYLAMGL